MASKHRRSPWCRDRSGRKEFWRGRGGVAGVVGTTSPMGLQGKHKQAVYAKNEEWYSGSSPSSEGEEWKSQDQQEKIKRLRAQGELLSKQQGTGKSLEKPGEPSRRGSGLEEGCKMEIEEATDCKKKLEEEKKSLQPLLWDIQGQTEGDLERRAGGN